MKTDNTAPDPERVRSRVGLSKAAIVATLCLTIGMLCYSLASPSPLATTDEGHHRRSENHAGRKERHHDEKSHHSVDPRTTSAERNNQQATEERQTAGPAEKEPAAAGAIHTTDFDRFKTVDAGAGANAVPPQHAPSPVQGKRGSKKGPQIGHPSGTRNDEKGRDITERIVFEKHGAVKSESSPSQIRGENEVTPPAPPSKRKKGQSTAPRDVFAAYAAPADVRDMEAERRAKANKNLTDLNVYPDFVRAAPDHRIEPSLSAEMRYEALLPHGSPFFSKSYRPASPLHPQDIAVVMALFKKRLAAAAEARQGARAFPADVDRVNRSATSIGGASSHARTTRSDNARQKGSGRGSLAATTPNDRDIFNLKDATLVPIRLMPAGSPPSATAANPAADQKANIGCRQGIVVFPLPLHDMVPTSKSPKKSKAGGDGEQTVTQELRACGRRLADAALLRRTHPDEQFRRHVASRVGPWYFKALVMSGVDIAPATQIFVPQACAYVLTFDTLPVPMSPDAFVNVMFRYKDFGATAAYTGTEKDRVVGYASLTVKPLSCDGRSTSPPSVATAAAVLPSSEDPSVQERSKDHGDPTITVLQDSAALTDRAFGDAWPPPLCLDVSGADPRTVFAHGGRFLRVPSAAEQTVRRSKLNYCPWQGSDFQYVYELPTRMVSSSSGAQGSSLDVVRAAPYHAAAMPTWELEKRTPSKLLTSNGFTVPASDPAQRTHSIETGKEQGTVGTSPVSKQSFWATALPGRVLCRAAPFSTNHTLVLDRCHRRSVLFAGDSLTRNIFRHAHSVVANRPVYRRYKKPPPWTFREMYARSRNAILLHDIRSIVTKMRGWDAVVMTIGHWAASPLKGWTFGQAMNHFMFVGQELTAIVRALPETRFVIVLSPARLMSMHGQATMSDPRLSFQSAVLAELAVNAGATVVDGFTPSYIGAGWNQNDDGVHHDRNGAAFAVVDALFDLTCRGDGRDS